MASWANLPPGTEVLLLGRFPQLENSQFFNTASSFEVEGIEGPEPRIIVDGTFCFHGRHQRPMSTNLFFTEEGKGEAHLQGAGCNLDICALARFLQPFHVQPAVVLRRRVPSSLLFGTSFLVPAGLLSAMYWSTTPMMSSDMNEKYGTQYGYSPYDSYDDSYDCGLQQDWMYFLDEIDTTDGSYCPSEAEMEASFNPSVVTSPMGEWLQQHSVLSSMMLEPLTQFEASGFAAGQLGTQPSHKPRRAVPASEPMKVQLPPEARSLPTLLDPLIPAKKMPKYATEFGDGLKSLDPKLPAKKRVPEILSEAGARAMEECDYMLAAR
ncbi:hypothetical protein AK812_SmicGene20825 [Symbiodinium microadriaticum]|uniref:Uncharacterized protein n=1 Tax=Symbiodinium microadriaticum TaxID=2951 RepID=A0A1Q9DNY5_SYMMI|nr:hypothetical protein AK812_SmicGene20825 [Symbiodinium microadriaticum]CAE7241611.1 unnamed protein product [Symbiodinium sp. KB8]CAE7331734.1 unnamed protein product [Symbiodinium microadriaticum]